MKFGGYGQRIRLKTRVESSLKPKRPSSVNFIRPRRLFTDRSFKNCAMQVFLAKDRSENDNQDLHASNGFVHNFKKRNGFRSGKGT
jgi:hypothetical protein